MKRKEFTDLKGKDIANLKKMVTTKKVEMAKAQVGDRNLRREIAKILTLIREKEILEKQK